MNPKDLRNCSRCNALCRSGEPSPESSQMLRRTDKPNGLCVNCAVREWFFIYQAAVPDLDPEELLIPHIRQQFEAVMRSSNAGADPSEIDWNKVVSHWYLPIGEKLTKKQRNKLKGWSPPLPMGEA